MSLTTGKPILKAALKAAFLDQNANTDENQTPEQAAELFATKLSNAVDAFVRSGTVTTFGNSSSQTGSIT